MLNKIPKTTYRPPHTDRAFTAEFDGTFARVESGTRDVLTAQVEAIGDRARLRLNPFEAQTTPDLSLAILLEALFGHHSSLKEITVLGAESFANRPTLGRREQGRLTEMTFSREFFHQLPCVWHRNPTYQPGPETWTETAGRRHPVRGELVHGTRYRRYVPSIGKTVSFRTVEVDRDLAKFHEWQNQPRVADLWELAKSATELRAYLEKGLLDPHQIPMMLEIDDEPAGYFEFYWGAEDRLGPYYEFDAYDRGLHFLIGETKFLGLETTTAVIASANHLMYLEDVRTRRLVAEPRADNQKVLKYVKIVPGWTFVKEFDFPHKRAALLMANREKFFAGGAL